MTLEGNNLIGYLRSIFFCTERRASVHDVKLLLQATQELSHPLSEIIRPILPGGPLCLMKHFVIPLVAT